MNGTIYQSVALAMRYVFVLMALTIVARAAWMTIRDARSAAVLRRIGEDARYIGVLVVSDGFEVSEYPIGREGTAGAWDGCDITLTGMNLKKRHFRYEIVGGRLWVTQGRNAFVALGDGGGEGDSIVVSPGETFSAGDAVIRFLLPAPDEKPLSPMARRAFGPRTEEREENWFEES